MVVYMLGNIGTHKSTHARYIADEYGMLLFDDDEIYHTLSNKSWRFYYDRNVQEVVNSMLLRGVVDTAVHDIDCVVASCSVRYDDILSVLDLDKHSQFRVVVTGNGDRNFSKNNRTKNSRGYPPEKWLDIYDREKDYVNNALRDGSSLQRLRKDQILTLEDTLDLEKTHRQFDNFFSAPRWLNKL